MIGTGGYGGQVGHGVRHVAQPASTVAPRHDSAGRLDAEAVVPGTCGDGYEVGVRRGNVALAVVVVPPSHDTPVPLEPEAVPAADCHGDEVLVRGGNIALPVVVVTPGHNTPVPRQPERVAAAGGHHHEVAVRRRNIALAVVIVAPADDGAVRCHGRVVVSVGRNDALAVRPHPGVMNRPEHVRHGIRRSVLAVARLVSAHADQTGAGESQVCPAAQHGRAAVQRERDRKPGAGRRPELQRAGDELVPRIRKEDDLRDGGEVRLSAIHEGGLVAGPRPGVVECVVDKAGQRTGVGAGSGSGSARHGLVRYRGRRIRAPTHAAQRPGVEPVVGQRGMHDLAGRREAGVLVGHAVGPDGRRADVGEPVALHGPAVRERVHYDVAVGHTRRGRRRHHHLRAALADNGGGEAGESNVGHVASAGSQADPVDGDLPDDTGRNVRGSDDLDPGRQAEPAVRHGHIVTGLAPDYDPAVGLEPHPEPAPGRGRHEIRIGRGYVALAVAVVPPHLDGSIRSQPHRAVVGPVDRREAAVRRGDVELAVVVISPGDDGAIGFQAHRMVVAAGHDDEAAVGRRHRALAVGIAAPGQDRPVRLQGQGVEAARRDAHESAVGRWEVALAMVVQAPAPNRPVRFETHGVTSATRDHDVVAVWG